MTRPQNDNFITNSFMPALPLSLFIRQSVHITRCNCLRCICKAHIPTIFCSGAPSDAELSNSVLSLLEGCLEAAVGTNSALTARYNSLCLVYLPL